MPTRREDFMALALGQAELARGRTAPNPPVGCVVVQRGKVVGQGFTQPPGSAHAEIEALEKAGSRARGADVYVTLEPCNHWGRTGPCTEALIQAGVGRVIIGARDPNPLVDGKGIRRLEKAGIEVVQGVLESACEQVIEGFTRHITVGRPFVVAKLAESLDGRVATRTGESKWITGEAARRRGHELRNQLDAILVGVGTVLADDPTLTCRIPKGRNPRRIVLDTQARTPVKARVLGKDAPTLVVVGKTAPVRRVRALERAGAEVVVCREDKGRVHLRALLDLLGQRDITSLLVEGGPTVLGAFFDAGLVDKVHSFVAPLIIGGERAKSSVGGQGAAKLAQAVRLKKLVVRQLGDDVEIVGYP